jgi:hypothetical protein
MQYAPRCQRDLRVDFRRGPLGPEGVCWSGRAYGVQGGGPEGAGVVITEDAPKRAFGSLY